MYHKLRAVFKVLAEYRYPPLLLWAVDWTEVDTASQGKNCIHARIPGTIIQNYPAGAVGSDRLGCSKYNCTDKGSLLMDLIGVISGGCCQCFVSVGIHSCASLLLPEGRERKYAVISHLQSVEVAEFKLDISRFLHHGGQTAESRKEREQVSQNYRVEELW
ncbi:hypothetical protein AAC387_Pa06g1886 [Persea americana]